MKWKILTIVALFGALLVAALNPPKAYACSCAPGTVKETLAYADAVFTGQVVGVRDEKRQDMNNGSFTAHIYTIAVNQYWKGISSSQVEAIFRSDYRNAEGLQVTSGCEGNGLVVGQMYLLYSSHLPETGELSAGIDPCGRTALVSNATADLQELGIGRTFSRDIVVIKEADPWTYWWLAAWVAAIIACWLVMLRMWRPLKDAGL